MIAQSVMRSLQTLHIASWWQRYHTATWAAFCEKTEMEIWLGRQRFLQSLRNLQGCSVFQHVSTFVVSEWLPHGPNRLRWQGMCRFSGSWHLERACRRGINSYNLLLGLRGVLDCFWSGDSRFPGHSYFVFQFLIKWIAVGPQFSKKENRVQVGERRSAAWRARSKRNYGGWESDGIEARVFAWICLTGIWTGGATRKSSGASHVARCLES